MNRMKHSIAVGQVIGRRTVLEGPVAIHIGTECRQHGYYRVRCECGNESWVRRAAMESGVAAGCKQCRDDRQRGKTKKREECR